MEKPRELYHDEITHLKQFRQKIDTKAIFKEDLDEFSDHYEDLIAQAKVITRVSDRLQKKLDKANIQIQDQNVEIKDKNLELSNTIEQLAKAKVGKRASTIMLTVGLLLFILEQIFLEPIIEANIPASYSFVGYIILVILFFIVKYFEGALEGYFMKQEKKKIIEQKGALEEAVL